MTLENLPRQELSSKSAVLKLSKDVLMCLPRGISASFKEKPLTMSSLAMTLAGITAGSQGIEPGYLVGTLGLVTTPLALIGEDIQRSGVTRRILNYYKQGELKVLTPEERDYHIQEVFKDRPLTNGTIWYRIMQEGALTDTTLDAIANSYQEYKELFPEDNPSVSQVLNRIGLKTHKDPLMDKVTFNYDGGLHAEDLLKQHLSEINEKRRKSLTIQDLQYMSVADRIRRELDELISLRVITSKKRFNQDTEAEEFVYLENGGHDPAAYYDRTLDLYRRKILPLLENGEMVKPAATSMTRFTYHPPTIVRELHSF